MMMKRRMWSGVMAVLACGVVMIGAGLRCGAAEQVLPVDRTGDMSSNDANALPVTLLLGPLTGSHLYREDKIVYSSAAQSMGTYEYSRWSEPPTEMIQDVLFRELRASGRYRTVNSLRSNAHGDFVLHGRLVRLSRKCPAARWWRGWRLSMNCEMRRQGRRCGRTITRTTNRWKARM